VCLAITASYRILIGLDTSGLQFYNFLEYGYRIVESDAKEKES